MSTGFNTDLQSILNNAKSQLSSLGAFNGSNGASSDNYLNSVWGLVQNGESAINGNDQQKAQAITNIVQNLMSMLTSLGTNENSKATKEVNNNDKNSNKLKQEADKKAQDTKADIKTIVNDIATNSNNISDAIEKIKELGGSEDDIQAAKENLDKQVQIIETNLAIVNDGVSSPEAKQKALALIKGAEFVLTDSFHGTAFSVIYHKSFYTFSRNGVRESMDTRVVSLLELLGLADRFEPKNWNLYDNLIIDFHNADCILENERKKAIEYLAEITQQKA